MCGITGSFGPVPADAARIDAALARLRERGPDAQGVYRGEVRGQALTLLHRRLSIIDLDPRADQPFETDGCVLAFNGEIYNYVELRRELEAAGRQFTTSSDTEVLAQAYCEWGEAFTDRLEGMWALALHDTRRDRLVLSRDRFGEKPLFTWFTGGTLHFGSEVAAIAELAGAWPQPDPEQIRRYLVNGYRALYKQPRSFYEGVRPLPAGTTAILDAPGEPEPSVYWQLRHRPQALSLDEAREGVRERLFRALELRLRADVPIAFCLSGGVDSSALAALAARHFGQRIHTFSIIDSDPRYDESDNIAATVAALGCDHHEIRTSTDGFLDRLARITAHHDAPVATISYYVHAALSEAIRSHGYKVAISGTAADELFTGYYDHYAFWLAARDETELPERLAEWQDSYGRFVNNPLLRDPGRFRADPSLRDHLFQDVEVFRDLMVAPFDEPFAEAHYTDDLLRNRMLNELFHEVIPVILNEDDSNSMMHSIENRSPYLDRELAEFAFTLPDAHLIRDGLPKWLLRDAVAGYLPDSVRLDRRKRGFNASILSLLDRSDPAVTDRLLDDSPIFDMVRRDRIAAMIEGDLSSNSYSKFLFAFISAKLFLDMPRRLGAEAERHAA